MPPAAMAEAFAATALGRARNADLDAAPEVTAQGGQASAAKRPGLLPCTGTSARESVHLNLCRRLLQKACAESLCRKPAWKYWTRMRAGQRRRVQTHSEDELPGV